MDKPKGKENAGGGPDYGYAPCIEVLEHCRASCCRQGGTLLTPAEADSGEYETEFFCLKRKEICNKDIECYYKIVQLKTNDLACIYIGDDNRCSIYERRPQVCRKFSCGIGGVSAPERAKFLERELMRLTPGLVFSLNPAVRLKAVIAERDRDSIYLLIRDREECDDTMYETAKPWPGAKEEQIVEVFLLFAGNRTLGEVEEKAAGLIGAAADPGDAVRSLVTACLRKRLLMPVHC